MVKPDERPSWEGRPARRSRLAAGEREAMVVAGAIRVVAAHGFGLSVRELAERVGVPHSVLFRFFPSKEALMRRLYDEVFMARLRPEWPALLGDGSRPPAQRLSLFYRDYTAAIFDESWVRLFLFSGLKGMTLNADYFRILRRDVLAPVAAALAPHRPPAEAIERAWALHGRIFYLAIRRFVYRRPLPESLDAVLDRAIAAALAAVPDPPRQAIAAIEAIDAAGAIGLAEPDAPEPAPEAKPPGMPRRMSPEARARSIVEGAIVFFARHGVDAQMRELARHLGIAHPLLFHYFPRKQDLVEQVFAEVFERPWQDSGRRILRDAAVPLAERLTTFYRAYLAVVDRAEWIRIFVSAGLTDAGFCGRYLDLVETEIIDVIVAEAGRLVRGEEGHLRRDELSQDELSQDELREHVWGLHGEIAYRAIRNHVYAIPPAITRAETVEIAVSSFLAGLAMRRGGPAAGALAGLAIPPPGDGACVAAADRGLSPA